MEAIIFETNNYENLNFYSELQIHRVMERVCSAITVRVGFYVIWERYEMDGIAERIIESLA